MNKRELRQSLIKRLKELKIKHTIFYDKNADNYTCKLSSHKKIGITITERDTKSQNHSFRLISCKKISERKNSFGYAEIDTMLVHMDLLEIKYK